MSKIIFFLITSIIIGQELEVQGNLRVDGEIDVSGNTLTNLADPEQETDAVNLRSLNQLGSQKPNRIYSRLSNCNSWSFTVPIGKVWKVLFAHGGCKLISDGYQGMGTFNPTNEFYLFSGDQIRSKEDQNDNCNNNAIFYIFEYNVTESGTDQGLRYIVP